MNVLQLVPKISHVAQNEIEITSLPEGSVLAAFAPNAAASPHLQTVHPILQSQAQWRHDEMQMVGHDHVSEK